jgi:2-polyprenyl-3-methyl-5-hydroxy-6-metoxy-1,4-benzoquinol methylase
MAMSSSDARSTVSGFCIIRFGGTWPEPPEESECNRRSGLNKQRFVVEVKRHELALDATAGFGQNHAMRGETKTESPYARSARYEPAREKRIPGVRTKLTFMSLFRRLFRRARVCPEVEYLVGACDLCGGGRTKIFKRKRAMEWEPVKAYYRDRQMLRDNFLKIPDEFTLVSCKGCGLVFVNPRLKDEVVNRFYEEYLAGKFAGYVQQYDSSFREGVLHEYIRIISEKCGLSGGVLLDVGCATGRLLKAAKASGWETYGIEVSDSAASEAKAFGTISIGDVNDCLSKLPDHRFDVVTIVDTLEHLKSPSNTLRLIFRKLKPGGTLFVEVPNVEAGLDEMTRHFHLFSTATLAKMLQRTGFRNVEELQISTAKYNPNDPEQGGRFIRMIARAGHWLAGADT